MGQVEYEGQPQSIRTLVQILLICSIVYSSGWARRYIQQTTLTHYITSWLDKRLILTFDGRKQHIIQVVCIEEALF